MYSTKIKSTLAVIGVAAATMLGGQTASATTLDFYAEAWLNERGLTDGDSVTFAGPLPGPSDDIKVTFDAFGDNAYFDHDGGLGVCSTGLTATLQCVDRADDNVTMNEAIQLSFDTTMAFSMLGFANAGHGPVNAADTLLFGYNGGVLVEYTFGQLVGKMFDGVSSVTFAYDNANNPGSANEFYLLSASAEVTNRVLPPVPLPAAGFMLIGALGALGAIRRRKQKA